MSAYVIIANGDFLTKDRIEQISQGKIMLALDGAAQQLRKLGITPQIILGDFDSLDADTQQAWGITQTFNAIDANTQSYVGNDNIRIIPSKDQSKTDLVKAIRYCDTQGASEITILCALGGRVDHDEGNKRALRLEYKKTRPINLYTETQLLRYVNNETIHVTGRARDSIAILGYPSALFSSTGLEYNGNQTPLSFGYDNLHNRPHLFCRICNAMKGTAATIIIQGEALLILTSPYRNEEPDTGA